MTRLNVYVINSHGLHSEVFKKYLLLDKTSDNWLFKEIEN